MDESLSDSIKVHSKGEKLEKQLVALSIQLTNCLFHENEEVVLESARALGEHKKHTLNIKNIYRI